MGLPDLPGKLSLPDPIAMLEALAAVTDEPPGLTRTFLSPALRESKRLVAGWMAAAGLEVFEDSLGNLIGRHAARQWDAPVVACGSHLDTVRNAGAFDGALGVVAAISAANALREVELPYELEVVAFSDEEGVRFQSTYLGSRFYAGDTSVMHAAHADAQGKTIAGVVAEHVCEFPPPPTRRLAAYLEVHIEQGPVLEQESLPLGVVRAIAGQTRLRVVLHGMAGHAGTVPMSLRRDALTGAAECIVAVERLVRDVPDAVATVGVLEMAAPASNVIPGEARFTVDIRSPDDIVRRDLVQGLCAAMEGIAARRGLDVEIVPLMQTAAVSCDARLMESLTSEITRQQPRCPSMVSGAGHDAVAIASAAPVGMIFVRCRGGVSHHPDEYAAPEDVRSAVAALTGVLRRLQP